MSLRDTDDIDEIGRLYKGAVSEWAESYWGERCPDYDPDCFCCRAWKAIDHIFEGIEEKPS